MNRNLCLLLSGTLLLMLMPGLTACGTEDNPLPAVSGTEDSISDGSDPLTQPDSAPADPVDTHPAETEPETIPAPTAPFSLCLYTGELSDGVSEVYDTLDEAIRACKKNAYLGYRVCDSTGRLVYAPYTELQCDLLREAKWVTDYVRAEGFTYGDAPINPAIDCGAKKVSCDRLVCWVYYRVGYTDQPRTQGLVVSNFFPWCERMGFEKITRVEDLQPGDLVGVRPSAGGTYPQHVFMYAGPTRYGSTPRPNGNSWRYDCGSDYRIQSVQPFNEALTDFMCAYRPVFHKGTATKCATGQTVALDLSYACMLAVEVRDAVWETGDGEPVYTYDLTVDGKQYRYASGTGILLDPETGLTHTVGKGFRQSFRALIQKAF